MANYSEDFFQSIRDAIDQVDSAERCQRYGYGYNHSLNRHRRIFYGALIANEPWELTEITAAETFGLFHAMAFVEGNRTQNFKPRSFRRLEHGPLLQQMYGASNVTVKAFVDEREALKDLEREAGQRNLILPTWVEQGMQPEDVGLLADADEVFSRDFLRAIQTCEVPALDYDAHRCQPDQLKILGATRVFESSPECLTSNRAWYHPDMLIGACLEGVGNETLHPRAPRKNFGLSRADGWDVKVALRKRSLSQKETAIPCGHPQT